MTWKLEFKEVCGCLIPVFFSTECFESALRYKPKSGDIFVATYPKCGTTWMQNIVLNILRKGSLTKQSDFFLASPFLDQLGAEDSENMRIRPGALKSHLPFHKIPWSEEALYIYVTRNPKDCAVSYYYHVKQIPVYGFKDGTWEDFFDCFLKGEVEFGDYFDHLISWYSQRHRSNILFIRFEDMRKDLRSTVMRVAEFLGPSHAEFLQRNNYVLNSILQNCCIDNMKKYINDAFLKMYNLSADEVLADSSIPRGRKHILCFNHLQRTKVENIEFVREGAVGNWKKLFTKEQNERFNERIRQKTAGTDVMNLWNDMDLLQFT